MSKKMAGLFKIRMLKDGEQTIFWPRDAYRCGHFKAVCCRTDAVAAAAESARKRSRAYQEENLAPSGDASNPTGSTKISAEFGAVYNAIVGSATGEVENHAGEGVDK